MNIIEEITLSLDKIKKIVVSEPYNKKEEIKKIDIRPIKIKNNILLQEEKIINKKAFHTNFNLDDFKNYFENEILKKYKQILIQKEGENINYFFNPNGKIKRIVTANKLTDVKIEAHNKEKSYILQEGEPIPALVDLGVFSKDFKIINSKYDKFKQINKFIEIVDEQFKNYNKDKITILDFGCGKSYLTFILYYYFVCKRKINAQIIGYDLKSEVVDECNKIAKKYNYTNLHFETSDISKEQDNFNNVDMIVTLHACDTATDYALYYAIKYSVPFVFSVPCCQHQINHSIVNGGDFDILLKDGLIKERFSALLTDAIRAQLLRENGYSVDMLEFVDFAHSPKNIMIRAKKVNKKIDKSSQNVKNLLDKYKISQELYNLISSNN